jgi:hypothetical protein
VTNFEALNLASRSVRRHIEDLDTGYQREKNHNKNMFSELAYKDDLEIKGAKNHIRDLGKQLNIYEVNNMKMHGETLGCAT